MPPPGAPTIPPEKGIELLKSQKEKGKQINADADYASFEKWMKVTRVCIAKAFGENHRNVEEFSAIEGQVSMPRHIKKTATIQALDGYLEELEIEITTRPEPVPAMPANSAPNLSKKIFIVHGHDGQLKEATANLVWQLQLEPVILHQQPKGGRTIIENFSFHAQEAGFAIVLLTGDDLGGKRENVPSLQPRARQNVVFEMGFFFGSLGRGKVCGVYEEGVEMPSDLGGILYVQYDVAGKWRYDVAKEIRAAGYDVNLSLL